MARYIIRRLLWGVLLLIIVSAVTFVLFRVFPTADPAKLRAGRLQDPKVIAAIRLDLGLNKPILTQFWLYMKGIFLHFDLGFSYFQKVSNRFAPSPEGPTAQTGVTNRPPVTRSTPMIRSSRMVC